MNIMKTPNIELMAKHYLIAAMLADKPEGTNPRITRQAEEVAFKTCAKFTGLIAQYWDEILECPDYWVHPDFGGHVEGALGHDLYLTSAGHGAGFFDRDALPEELRETLTWLCGWRKAIAEPEVSFYRGWVYL